MNKAELRGRRDLYLWVSRILLTGVVLSLVIITIGIALVLSNPQGEMLNATAVPAGDILERVTKLDPIAWVSLGVLFLIATPIVRVIGSIVTFAVEGDFRYVSITALVLVVLLFSILVVAGGRFFVQS